MPVVGLSSAATASLRLAWEFDRTIVWFRATAFAARERGGGGVGWGLNSGPPQIR
jgi:hypothetical protein